MQPVILSLENYANFAGRARRSEYWLWQLFTVIVGVGGLACLGVLGSYEETHPDNSGLAGGLALGFLLISLALIIPSLAVAFRRLHDSDKPAAWLLIGFVPVIGWLVLLIFMLTDGTMGPNRYGADPKGRAPFAPGVVKEVHHYHHDGPVTEGPAAAEPTL